MYRHLSKDQRPGHAAFLQQLLALVEEQLYGTNRQTCQRGAMRRMQGETESRQRQLTLIRYYFEAARQ
jgi:hypothetical protein